MTPMNHIYMRKAGVLLAVAVLALGISCKKMIEAGQPKTELPADRVFVSDDLAKAAMTGVYKSLQGGYANGDYYSATVLAAESADDLINASPSDEFFSNNVLPQTFGVEGLWDGPYKDIYACNSILEGLDKGAGVSAALKTELTGEAKFVRAYSYFYLVNLFGDVPLVMTTDYRTNAVIPRAAQKDVNDQIVTDLKDAQASLKSDYSFSNNERVRPNALAATAMLARQYLYMKDWTNAEIEAGKVIASPLYRLTGLDSVFLKNSKEAIWQLSFDNQNSNEGGVFAPSSDYPPFYVSLNPGLANAFDPSDQRGTHWVYAADVFGDMYYYPYKYKNASISPITEYSMVIRLAEMYLVRAEARVHLNKLTGGGSAEEDIDAVRTRAGLAGTAAATQDALLQAVEDERRFELFTEWGHRWLDLKRTGRADAVLGGKPGWAGFKQLYPIPKAQMDNDPAMAGHQNPGY